MFINSKGTGVLVVGMHRSGTSALTGSLQASGVTLGSPLIAQDRFNEKGYLELKEVIQIHEAFLRHFSLDGASLASLPINWEQSDAAETARLAIKKLFQMQFANAKVWALKDPRLCRALPLWQQALPDVSLKVILALRHPLEVANSLLSRNNFSINRGLLLWIQNVLEAEKNSREMTRSTVCYNELIDNPSVIITRLESDLELKWPLIEGERIENINHWIEPNLKHYTVSKAAIAQPIFKPLIDTASELYRFF